MNGFLDFFEILYGYRKIPPGVYPEAQPNGGGMTETLARFLPEFTLRLVRTGSK